MPRLVPFRPYKAGGGDLSNNLLAYVMPEGSEQISAYLLAFSQQARSLTWIGVVFLFITALMLLRTIEMQFNRIWNVDKPRSGLQNFFRYWAVLSLGPLLIGGAIAASSLVASLPMVADLDKVPLPFRFFTLVIQYCGVNRPLYAGTQLPGALA